MGEELMVSGAVLTCLDRIATEGGEVMKAMTSDDPTFNGFGEAYFSRVDPLAVRAWKLHTEMTVNVVVAAGHVRFVISHEELFDIYDLGPQHQYGRLTIAPGTWFGFQGGAEGGLVLNLSNIVHHPDEGRSKGLDEFEYSWS